MNACRLIKFFRERLHWLKIKGIEVKIHSKSRVTDVQRVHESQPQMRVTYTELVSGATQAVVVDAAILCTGEQQFVLHNHVFTAFTVDDYIVVDLLIRT
jgi:hypothetical protein